MEDGSDSAISGDEGSVFSVGGNANSDQLSVAGTEISFSAHANDLLHAENEELQGQLDVMQVQDAEKSRKIESLEMENNELKQKCLELEKSREHGMMPKQNHSVYPSNLPPFPHEAVNSDGVANVGQIGGSNNAAADCNYSPYQQHQPRYPYYSQQQQQFHFSTASSSAVVVISNSNEEEALTMQSNSDHRRRTTSYFAMSTAKIVGADLELTVFYGPKSMSSFSIKELVLLPTVDGTARQLILLNYIEKRLRKDFVDMDVVNLMPIMLFGLTKSLGQLVLYKWEREQQRRQDSGTFMDTFTISLQEILNLQNNAALGSSVSFTIPKSILNGITVTKLQNGYLNFHIDGSTERVNHDMRGKMGFRNATDSRLRNGLSVENALTMQSNSDHRRRTTSYFAMSTAKIVGADLELTVFYGPKSMSSFSIKELVLLPTVDGTARQLILLNYIEKRLRKDFVDMDVVNLMPIMLFGLTKSLGQLVLYKWEREQQRRQDSGTFMDTFTISLQEILKLQNNAALGSSVSFTIPKSILNGITVTKLQNGYMNFHINGFTERVNHDLRGKMRFRNGTFYGPGTGRDHREWLRKIAFDQVDKCSKPNCSESETVKYENMVIFWNGQPVMTSLYKIVEPDGKKYRERFFEVMNNFVLLGISAQDEVQLRQKVMGEIIFERHPGVYRVELAEPNDNLDVLENLHYRWLPSLEKNQATVAPRSAHTHTGYEYWKPLY